MSMTTEDLRARIQSIIDAGNGDPEGSHERSDAVCAEVIEEIAAGNPDAQQLAAQVKAFFDYQVSADWDRYFG